MPYAPPFVPKLFLLHAVSEQQYICSAGGNQLIVDIRDHSDWRCFGSHDKKVVRYVLSRARQTGKTRRQLQGHCTSILCTHTLFSLRFLYAAQHSGMIEFDEFLDIMWDVKHAKGRAQGLLFSRAGIFLEGTLHAAQAALQSKRQQMRTPLGGASGLGGLLSHRHDTKADGMSFASRGSDSLATNAAASASSISSGEKKREEQDQPIVLQKRQMAMTRTTLSAAMARGKEAAISALPKLSGKTMKWRGFSRTL